VAVLHQHVAQIAEFGFLTIPFAVQPSFGIRLGFMRFVAAPFAAELVRLIVSDRPFVSAVLLLKALLACPSLDQRAVHTEVFVGEVRLGLR
jgi:hypothetical protein